MKKVLIKCSSLSLRFKHIIDLGFKFRQSDHSWTGLNRRTKCEVHYICCSLSVHLQSPTNVAGKYITIAKHCFGCFGETVPLSRGGVIGGTGSSDPCSISLVPTVSLFASGHFIGKSYIGFVLFTSKNGM